MDFRVHAVLGRRLKELTGDEPSSKVIEAVNTEIRRRGYYAKDVIISSMSDDVLSDVIFASISGGNDASR